MTFAIAAAGTGGHVYPGLAVGEALVAAGVGRSEILYIGGERLEASIYPQAGYPFLRVELQGLQRRLTLANLALPGTVRRAVAAIGAELERRSVRALLGMGGYVTVPAGLGCRRRRIPFALAEQNAEAGLANRVMGRLAHRVFGSFPTTRGLPGAEWVGNPIRHRFVGFSRTRLRPGALRRFGLSADLPVVGVFGGSLGADALNDVTAGMAREWQGRPIQLLHLAGRGAQAVAAQAEVSSLRWVVLDFLEQMEEFYAAADLVVARAGGSVAELTATATPSILVPGGFGSRGHQDANAAALATAGAAVRVTEDRLTDLPTAIHRLLDEPARLAAMASACEKLARPAAADDIAAALLEMRRS